MNNNQQRSAIGLLYQEGSAPHVSAKGFGELAQQIIEAAEQQGILIHQDKELANALAALQQGQEIPPELYYVIAELIAFSYVLRGKYPPGWQNFSNKLNIKA
ncbi:EscU/YscU/HrcU family type III secretion system export apparatus switch protein [Pseudoalteromonas sp. T1lg48]|uniref:EscU/YscU/HrcU family type III secretion system export apparatus switch protein n=1 Tax=Pseudoalteromonas sp. T1lg48 TaxID=2077100 RepID=UPI000CF637A2|nr:EscU/YscU/HrcU family type III secretion system export apparatus switch protein [Pseudoalteromonas sp. T1lg48]